MFYPVESLKRGGRFYLCWIADSYPIRFHHLGSRQLWSQDVRKLCEDLFEVMTNESGNPRSRFSLRLSSQLMRGLVRVYQRKVDVFLGELCMMNANIFRHSNKKWNIQEKSPVKRKIHLPLPAVQATIPDNENVTLQALEELLQNSGNLVSNAQEITLKEAAMPEQQMPIDGFGEENIIQQLQQLTNMSVEMMLQDPNQAQQTSYEVPMFDVTEKSHDKSRLLVEQHMERMSDHDMTLFRKSTGDELQPPIEAEKDLLEIPDIPQIPQPEFVPEPEKQTSEEPVIPPTEPQPPTEPANENDQEQLQLEELEEQPQARRRRKRGLIIDKSTKLSSNFLKPRIDNVNVELRCEDPSDDIVDLQVPAEVLFRRPCHAGHRFTSHIALTLWEKFQRNLDARPERDAVEQEFENVMHQRQRQSKSVIENIPEVAEPIAPVLPEIRISEVATDIQMQMSEQNLNITGLNLSVQQPVEVMDIAEMPTQKIETISQREKRVSELEKSPKRRHYGEIKFSTFRHSHQLVVVAEVHTFAHDRPEKRVEVEKEPSVQIEPEEVLPKDTEKGVSVMLQKVGLADLPAKKTQDFEEQINTVQQRKQGSEGSETPLGSLDRTKVSLGDSEKTTDSKRFIRDQWGTEGTMVKILNCIKNGDYPLTVQKLVAKGPLIRDCKAIIAARCFSSILKLKQHGFIKVTKVPGTNEIQDIVLGPKFE